MTAAGITQGQDARQAWWRHGKDAIVRSLTPTAIRQPMTDSDDVTVDDPGNAVAPAVGVNPRAMARGSGERSWQRQRFRQWHGFWQWQRAGRQGLSTGPQWRCSGRRSGDGSAQWQWPMPDWTSDNGDGSGPAERTMAMALADNGLRRMTGNGPACHDLGRCRCNGPHGLRDGQAPGLAWR